MIAIATRREDVDRLSKLLEELEADVVEVVDPTDDRCVALAVPRVDGNSEHVAAALRTIGEMAVSRPVGGAALRRWSEETEPVVVSDRLSVCLAWSEHDRRGLTNLVEIGPGGFGSGHHPTTRLILDYLDTVVRAHSTVLDVGCGSGILSLSAVRLGAARVVAVDLKPEAVDATARNAVQNGMARRIDATATPIESLTETFDIVLANIARAGIVALADALVGCVAPGGSLAVSGITPAQGDLVAGYLRPLRETARLTTGDWTMLVFAAVED